MKYVVSIGGREIEVDVDGDRVTSGGKSYSAALSEVPGTPLRHLVVDGRQAEVLIESAGQGRWSVGLRGERWECEVLDERTRHIRSLTASSHRSHGPAALRAPMPGLVIRVEVEPGQSVAAGTGVLVLEAMKMENELRAGTQAVIRAVRVAPGDAVEKGQVLVEFE